MDSTVVVIILAASVIWWILEIIGNWKLFKKAGRSGVLSIIPFVNIYTEYNLCWKGSRGILMIIALVVANSISQEAAEGSGALMAIACIAAIICIYLQIAESRKLAKAFGKGMGWTLILIIFDRLGRIALGFGSAQYVGKR